MAVLGPQPGTEEAQRAALAASGPMPGGPTPEGKPVADASAAKRQSRKAHDPDAEAGVARNTVPGGAAHVATTTIIDPSQLASSGRVDAAGTVPSLAARAPDSGPLPALAGMPRPQTQPLSASAVDQLYGVISCQPSPVVSDAMVAAVIVEASNQLQTDYRQAKWGYYAQQYEAARASADKLRDEAGDTLSASKIKSGLTIGFACLAAGFTGGAFYKSMKGLGSGADKVGKVSAKDDVLETADRQLGGPAQSQDETVDEYDNILRPRTNNGAQVGGETRDISDDRFEDSDEYGERDVSQSDEYGERDVSQSDDTLDLDYSNEIRSDRENESLLVEEGTERTVEESIQREDSFGNGNESAGIGDEDAKKTGLEQLYDPAQKAIDAQVGAMNGLAQVMNALGGGIGELASAWETHDAQLDHAQSATIDATASLRREEAEQAGASEETQGALNRAAIDVVKNIYESEVSVIESSMRSL